MTYIAYLDEFGHIGPYVQRSDPKHNSSPVFGLAGFVMPVDEVRGFGTWFFQRKCQLLGFEIQRSGKHPAGALYSSVLAEAIERIDAFCRDDQRSPARFFLALDEHALRAELLTVAARGMYGADEPRRQLIEPPFQLESHRYQTVQAADWIAGLVGRLGAVWKEPEVWPENVVFRRYFEHRLTRIQVRSGIRD